MEEILVAYRVCRKQLSPLSNLRLGRGAGWDRFTATRVITKTRSLATLAELADGIETILNDPDTCHGWVLWQRDLGLAVISGRAFLECLREQRAPLDAELGCATQSIAILYRYNAWYLTHLHEHEAGDPMLACDHRLLARPPAPGALKYRIYWQADEECGYRASLSRFLEFAPNQVSPPHLAIEREPSHHRHPHYPHP